MKRLKDLIANIRQGKGSESELVKRVATAATAAFIAGIRKQESEKQSR